MPHVSGKSRWKLLIGLVVVAVAASVWGFNRWGNRQKTVALRNGALIEAVYGLGSVLSERTFKAKPGISTTIRKLFVREGDFVKKGDPIITTDETGTIRSPLNATVTAIPYREGENVFPQVAIAVLEDLSSLVVEVSLEQEGALRVKPGQKATLTFESVKGKKYTGKVRTLYPVEKQFLVRIDMNELPQGVLPGMTADVAIEVARKEQALLIPVAALSSGSAVVVHKNGKKEKLAIEIGALDGEWAEVLSKNVTVEDSVIVRSRAQ